MKHLIFTIILLIPIIGSAQMNFTGGPTNVQGNCPALWADGNTAFMAFNDGLYRTTDGGTNWTQLANGIPADVDPRTIEYSNDVLIVGTNDGSRIYRSTDFGDSFTGGTGTITSLAIPTASTSGPNLSMMGGTTFDPYIYNFNNEDWTSAQNGGITHGMSYLGGDTVWICSGSIASGTTKYSHDNGQTWTAVTTEPETDIGGGIIFSSIAQDFLKVGNRIIVGSNLNGFPILYTDDYGETWSAGDLPNQAFSDYGKRFIRINDNHILTVNVSGIWKSEDQGESWNMIQELGAIRTMVLWKNDHLLVGTANGVFEYSDYGSGELIKQHGTATTASNLIVHADNSILSATVSGIYKYTSTAGGWSLLNNQTADGNTFVADRLAVVGDTLYAFGAGGYFTSADEGVTFNKMSNGPFNAQILSTVTLLAGKKFAASRHNGGGFPQEPTIFYSTDNGENYSAANFTNSVSVGLGGVAGNYVEQFLEMNGALVADMNAGYAISTDDGENWTFYGGPWDRSILATKGDQIYHFKTSALAPDDKSLEVSNDLGQSWNAIDLTGLPNAGGANYKGYFGIWNLDGELYTYNAFEAPRGIYRLDEGSNQWEIVPGSAFFYDDWDGLTDLYLIDNNFYTNWFLNGTWTTGFTVPIKETPAADIIQIYPNPFLDFIMLQNLESESVHMTIYDNNARQMKSLKNVSAGQQIDLSYLHAGLYYLKIVDQDRTLVQKIIKY